MVKNGIKTILPQIFFILNFKLWVLTFSCLSGILYLMNWQIQVVSGEIENLLPLIEYLKETQTELTHQLLVKDQQIKVLETTINSLKTNISTLSQLNETQNLETFKQEILKSNISETANFYLKLAGVTVSVILFVMLARNIKATFFTEVLELKFFDPVNNLMWSVKIPEDKKTDLIIKKIEYVNSEQIVEFVKTVTIKTTDTYLRGAPDGLELISSSVPVSERILAASQISEVLSSTGLF